MAEEDKVIGDREAASAPGGTGILTQEEAVQEAVPVTARRAGAAPSLEEAPAEAPPLPPSADDRKRRRNGGGKTAITVTVVLVAIVGLSAWYLSRPTPLIIQGEADSTRIDIAARVDGRISKIPVVRGQNVDAGSTLLSIDNPELVAKYEEAIATKGVAEAELARIHAGTRAETIAVRKAEIDRTAAEAKLAQQSYDRIRQLTAGQFATQQKLDEMTDALRVAQRSYDQAMLAYAEAVAGFTPEEVRMAETKVAQADAAAKTLKSLVDQMVVTAPADTQVYQIDIEQGEVVAPGIPLLSLVDLNDIWLHFDLREDLLRDLKLGDEIEVRIPALDDREVVAEVRLIASKGEYAGWRATRATGDFDLRTFAIRAYPAEKIVGLRPGMSAYAEWPLAKQ
jgi:HlyD family secretion protein